MVYELKEDLSNIDELIEWERFRHSLYFDKRVLKIIRTYDIDCDIYLGIYYIHKPIPVQDFTYLRKHFTDLGLKINKIVVKTQ